MLTINENTPAISKKNPFCKVILVILLLVQTGLLTYLSWSTSPNRTEVGHLGATVYLWNYCKFDVFSVNPPLVRFVAGIPIALFCNPKYDWSGYSPRPQDRCEWKLGNAFIAANELEDLRLYVFLARIFCIPLVLLGGYFGFRFASELYCGWSGVLFLILWTFSPFILGWGATICPDVAATSVGIVGLYSFWHWLKNPQWKKAIIAGICLGLMPFTKMTWIIAPLIWLILWIFWRFLAQKNEMKPPFLQFAVIMLLALYTINASYFFDGSFRSLNKYQFISGILTNTKVTRETPVKSGNRFKDSWLGHIPIPLPADFVQGIDTQKRDFERGLDSYTRGVWSDHGWWWYYGYVLILKEPLGIWCLAVIALIITCFGKANLSIRNELIILFPLLIVFVFVSSQTGISIHPRYIIPILPLIYIFLGKIFLFSGNTPLLTDFGGWHIIQKCAGGCLTWIIISSLWIYPHSMSYFNELAGKPENWSKYLLGSAIDWGQESYALQEWCMNHPEFKPLFITYQSGIPLNKLGITQSYKIPHVQTSGWMVIGVNELHDKEGKYGWLKKQKTIMMIGSAIGIYHIDI